MKTEITITESSGLDILLNAHEQIRFAFNFPNFNAEQNQSWTTNVRKHYFACGCDTGAKFMLVATAMAIAFLLYVYFWSNAGITLYHPIGSVLFIIIMAGLGKGLGILNAKYKLKNEVEKLKISLVQTNKLR